MRCPYCGGLNRDQSIFCVNCGRDLRALPPAQQPQQPAIRPGVNAPNSESRRGYPTPLANPQNQAPRGYQPTQPQPAQTSRRNSAQTVAPLQPAPMPVPEAPGPFPPRTMSQFEALVTPGAQTYTVIESTIGNGKRKLVRIAYAAVTHWQQAATLFKALKEQQDTQCSTIIIQGVSPQQANAYDFTQGELQFDRAARLGSQISNRYVVVTGNGFADNAVRFVLNE